MIYEDWLERRESAYGSLARKKSTTLGHQPSALSAKVGVQNEGDGETTGGDAQQGEVTAGLVETALFGVTLLASKSLKTSLTTINLSYRTYAHQKAIANH